MHNPHKLHLDSNRNTKNIKIIKIAIEKCQYMEENMRCDVHFAEICTKIWQHVKYAAVAYSHKSVMPNYLGHFLLD